MRIAQLAPPWISVPPVGYGGIEWVVSLLADGLTDAGHQVDLYASGDSVTRANLVSPFADEQRYRMGETFPDVVHAVSCYIRQDEYDIIHDHSGIIGPAIGAAATTPVLHTLHGPFTDDAKRFYGMLSGHIWYNTISDYQQQAAPGLSYIDTIHNAVDLSMYPFRAEKEDFLLYLGRLSELKGAHIAVQTAKELGMKLKLVGKLDNSEEQTYFDTKVKPYLGGDIEFVGEVSTEEKVDILSRAKATLFPIQWPEPFGLVMPESFACGTPVIAFRNGSVPEVMRDGVNGFIVEDLEGMIDAVKRIDEIDPHACRRDAEERFGVGRMVREYVDAYERIIAAKDAAKDAAQGASQAASFAVASH